MPCICMARTCSDRSSACWRYLNVGTKQCQRKARELEREVQQWRLEATRKVEEETKRLAQREQQLLIQESTLQMRFRLIEEKERQLQQSEQRVELESSRIPDGWQMWHLEQNTHLPPNKFALEQGEVDLTNERKQREAVERKLQTAEHTASEAYEEARKSRELCEAMDHKLGECQKKLYILEAEEHHRTAELNHTCAELAGTQVELKMMEAQSAAMKGSMHGLEPLNARQSDSVCGLDAVSATEALNVRLQEELSLVQDLMKNLQEKSECVQLGEFELQREAEELSSVCRQNRNRSKLAEADVQLSTIQDEARSWRSLCEVMDCEAEFRLSAAESMPVIEKEQKMQFLMSHASDLEQRNHSLVEEIRQAEKNQVALQNERGKMIMELDHFRRSLPGTPVSNDGSVMSKCYTPRRPEDHTGVRGLERTPDRCRDSKIVGQMVQKFENKVMRAREASVGKISVADNRRPSLYRGCSH